MYNGRAMVIGCAMAGKTTLVKKIKGDKDLTTTSTSGIEIHSHAFKLNPDESTISGKYFLFQIRSFSGVQISDNLSFRLLFLFLYFSRMVKVTTVSYEAVF